MTSSTTPPVTSSRKPRMTIVKPESKNPVWDELEQLARQYRALPPNPQTAPHDTPAEDPQRVHLRQRIWQLMAGTWVCTVAAAVREDDPDAVSKHPDEQPGELLRRDSALEQLFRIKAHKLAHVHGDGLIRAYGGPTDLSASAQQAFFEEKLGRMAEKRRVTVLSAVLHAWDPTQSNLQTYLGRAVENFIKTLATRLYARHGENHHLMDAQLPELHVFSPADKKEDDADGPDLQDRPADPDSDVSQQERAQEQAEARELFEAVQQAVDALPEQQRGVFQAWLKQQEEDLTDEQAAALAGLHRSTYIRQRDKLAQVLRQQIEALE